LDTLWKQNLNQKQGTCSLKNLGKEDTMAKKKASKKGGGKKAK
jgi:hypothetical protein